MPEQNERKRKQKTEKIVFPKCIDFTRTGKDNNSFHHFPSTVYIGWGCILNHLYDNNHLCDLIWNSVHSVEYVLRRLTCEKESIDMNLNLSFPHSVAHTHAIKWFDLWFKKKIDKRNKWIYWELIDCMIRMGLQQRRLVNTVEQQFDYRKKICLKLKEIFKIIHHLLYFLIS